MATTIELARAPSTLNLYVRAATAKKHGNIEGDSLPKLSVTLRNVQANYKKLTKYREVCGFPLSGSMPATYPHILAFPLHMELLVSEAFPFPLLGLVHVRNEITQYRAIGNQEVLDIECVLGGPREVAKGKEFDITTYTHVDGQLVWESVSTMLHRCKTSLSDDKKPKPQDSTEPETVISWPVEENIGRRYAKVSGDSNLIHIHAITAKLFGFKQAIAHGMWTKARCLAELDSAIPNGPFKVSVSFKLPVFLPANVQFQCNQQEREIAFEVKDAKGEKPHLAGTIKAL